MKLENLKELFTTALETNDTELFMDLGDICHLLAQLTKKVNSLNEELPTPHRE